MHEMDFLTAVKASSIVLTGGFGMLGVVKDFKDKKTNEVTIWGYVSVAGILLCTALGLAAQLKESSADAAKELALARTSAQTLKEIEKISSPLDGALINMSFDVACETKIYSSYCREVQKENHKIPEIDPPLSNAAQRFGLWVGIYKDPTKAAEEPLSNDDADWSFLISIGLEDGHSLMWFASGEHIWVNLNGYAIANRFVIKNNGVIKSLIDLRGTTGYITMGADYAKTLIPTDFALRLKNGREIKALDFEKVGSADGKPFLYRFTFPSTP